MASPSVGGASGGSLPQPDADAPVRVLEPGSKLGQYTIVEKIGEGGMGLVYKATDTLLDRPVALKVMFCGEHEDQRQAQRFEREARAMARLSHPNLVHVYSVGAEAGCHYFAMELLRGETLLQAIRRLKRISMPELMNYMVQIVSALFYVHGNNITHRDVKSGNIMLCGRRAVLMDFGLAKDETDSGLTSVGAIMGTPDYMPPEAAEGRSMGPPTDIYSFGVVMYEALSGRLPFTGKSAISIIRQHIDTAPQPLQTLVPQIRPELARIVHTCLAKKPEERFADCRALARALWELVPEQLLLDVAEGKMPGADALPLEAMQFGSGLPGVAAPPSCAQSDAPAPTVHGELNPTVTHISNMNARAVQPEVETSADTQAVALERTSTGRPMRVRARQWGWGTVGFAGTILLVGGILAWYNWHKAKEPIEKPKTFSGQPIVRKGAPSAEREVLLEFKGGDPDPRNWYFLVKREQADGSWKELRIPYREYVSQKSDTELIFTTDDAQRKP